MCVNVLFLVHYSFGSTFSWYYSTFGGFGAIANGERGLALYKALMNRWISAAKEWEIRPVFDFIIAKMEDPDRRKVPLTEEECLSLLPESKKAWSDFWRFPKSRHNRAPSKPS